MRRRGVVAVLVVLTVAVLTAVGRWERDRAVDHEVSGMRAVLAAVGGKPNADSISGWRDGPPECLSYYADSFVFALQMCFSEDGRLVLAVDRRGPTATYYSLEYEPSLSPIRYPPSLIDELVRRARAASR